VVFGLEIASLVDCAAAPARYRETRSRGNDKNISLRTRKLPLAYSFFGFIVFHKWEKIYFGLDKHLISFYSENRIKLLCNSKQKCKHKMQAKSDNISAIILQYYKCKLDL